jgi:small-conductance mechanosensitive channel
VARGERVSASRARIAAPLVVAVVTIASAALVSSLLGLSVVLVLAISAGVAIAGAIVAHRTTSSVLAGLALLVIRPYAPGERVRLPSPVDGTLIDAEVVRIGLANTTLATDSGLLVVANNRLLKGVPGQPESDVCW